MRVAAVLMVVALLFPALAYANEVQEGSARAPNESVDLIGGVDLGNRWPIFVDSLGRMRVIPMGYNGSSWDSLRVDASGILKVTESYPVNAQMTTKGLGSSVPITSTAAKITTGMSLGLYKYREFVISYVSGGAPNYANRIELYPLASDDNVNWSLIMFMDWTSNPVVMDTMKIVVDFSMGESQRFTIDGPLGLYRYGGNYIAFSAAKDSAGTTLVDIDVALKEGY